MSHVDPPRPTDPDPVPTSADTTTGDPQLRSQSASRAPGRAAKPRADALTTPSERNALLQRYHAVIEAAPEAIVLADAEGRLLRVNRRANSLFGYAGHELVGRTLDIVVPEWFEHAARLLQSAVFPSGPLTHVPEDLFGRRRDGSEFRIQIIAGALAGGHPALIGIAMRPAESWTPTFGLTSDEFDLQETQADHALARALAQVELRLATERQNQSLRKQAVAAMQSAASSAAQMRALQALTDTALAHLDLEDLLPAVLDRVRDTLEVDNAMVFLLDGTRDEHGKSNERPRLVVRAARGPEAGEAADARVPIGEGFVGRIATTRLPLIASDLSEYPNMKRRLREQANSAVGAPLLLQGHVLGALCVTSTSPRQFTGQDVQFLELVAERVTVAIERAERYEAERRARAEAEAARAEALVARAEAERQAAQLDRIFEQMTEALVVYDAEGHIMRENAVMRRLRSADIAPSNFSQLPLAERLMLFSPRDAEGRALAAEDTPQMRALRGETLSGVHALDMRMRTLDGRELELRIRGTPLREADGRIVGAVLVGADQTERNRLMRERQEALVASEAWFRAISDTAPVFIWATGPDGSATFINLPWLQFTGRTLEQELGRGWAEGLHPDDYERSLKTYRAAFDARQPFTMDYRLRRADGEYRWLVATGVPRVAPDGIFLGFIGTAMDITERRQLEEEREEARVQAERRAEELDRVFEAMADGVAVYDQNGREMRANAAYQRLIGLDAAPPDYVERSLPERMALFDARDEHGQTLAPADGPLPRALAGQVVGGAEAMDIRSRSLDGREIELRVSAAPLRSATGELVGAVSVFRDVTEHKRLQRDLAEQAEQLERIIESMGEALFVYDKQGQMVRANAAAHRLLGLDAAPPEFYDLPAEERMARYAPRDADGNLLSPGAWLTLRAERDTDVLREPEARDIHMRTLDGRELDVSASMAPLRDPDGQVVGGVLLLSDRTEQNQLTREREEARASELSLQELNQRLDTFVTIAAHDLRRHVTVSKMRVEVAQRRVQQAASNVRGAAEHAVPFIQAANALDIAKHSLARLAGLMEQLLDVTRARQGALDLNRQPCDLAALVREGVEEQRLLAPNRLLTLDLPDAADPGGQPVVVDADAERLSQALINYLTNADRYSPEDQPVEVAVRVVEQTTEGAMERVARVSVHDHGPGIATDARESIWNQFQRAHTVREAMGGLGLGLYIVRIVVRLHGGQVGVESTPGDGATFWFTLPLAPAER